MQCAALILLLARVVRAGRRRGEVADEPDQRDIEGLGGQFWYEARLGRGEP